MKKGKLRAFAYAVLVWLCTMFIQLVGTQFVQKYEDNTSMWGIWSVLFVLPLAFPIAWYQHRIKGGFGLACSKTDYFSSVIIYLGVLLIGGFLPLGRIVASLAVGFILNSEVPEPDNSDNTEKASDNISID